MKSPARIIFEKEIDRLMKSDGFDTKTIASVRQYYKKVSDNMGYAVSFGIASYLCPGHLKVGPGLSICFDNVSKLLYQLEERQRYHKYYLLPTVWTQLYEYLPGNRFFEYDLDQSNPNAIPATCRQIKSDIHNYGSIFFNEYKEWSNVVSSFEQGIILYDSVRDTTLPVMYYLMGNKQKGLDYIKSRLEEPLTSPDSVRMNRKAYSDINSDIFLKNYYALPEIPDPGLAFK